jgi:hypothetical protein
LSKIPNRSSERICTAQKKKKSQELHAAPGLDHDNTEDAPLPPVFMLDASLCHDKGLVTEERAGSILVSECDDLMGSKSSCTGGDFLGMPCPPNSTLKPKLAVVRPELAISLILSISTRRLSIPSDTNITPTLQSIIPKLPLPSSTKTPSSAKTS